MKRASKSDRNLVVKILMESFRDNKSVNYIVSPIGNTDMRIRHLMEYSFDLCILFGDVWLADNETGCALALYPDRRRATIRAIWLDIRLIFSSIGVNRIFKVLKRESRIKRKQLPVPMYYLWFIGVNKDHQHQGVGTKLLTEVINYATKISRPIFLETSTPTNLPWYKRFGFQVYDELTLSYVLYFLKNEPAK